MRLLETLEKYLSLVVLFLLPFLVLPFFANPFETPKVAILGIGTLIILFIRTIRMLFGGKLNFWATNLDLPLFILFIAYILSGILRTPNKMEAFFFPGGASVVAFSVLFYFLLEKSESFKKSLALTLFLSGVLTSITYLLAASGILAKVSILPAVFKIANFSPLGGILPQAIFSAIVLPLGLSLLLSEKETIKKLFYTVSFAIVVLGLATSVFFALPGKIGAPALPPFDTSWQISIEALKQSPILGVGPGNYLTAFNRFRPISYNSTDFWAVRFTSANNFVLTLITEVGLLGLLAFVLLIVKIVKSVNLGQLKNFGSLEYGYTLSWLLTLILTLVFPANTPLLALLIILPSLFAKSHEVNFNLSVQPSEGSKSSRFPAFLIGIPLVIALAFLGYWAGRALAAEAKYKLAIEALSRNDGRLSYDTLRQTLSLNPYVDRYHSAYLQLNLALARSLASKENLTDEERNTVAQLIQQAIREGKNTITLNPSRSTSWEVLARTYQAIMAIAQGADNFTITTFNQAIALDPLNPNLRISLGGVYYALGRYDDAIKAFELAIAAKPDLANAHYNMAIALREKGDIEKAINEMTAVLSLVNKDSNDYQLAKTELENLEKRRPSKASQGSETLTPPQQPEKSNIEPPIKLPEEATPPSTTQ